MYKLYQCAMPFTADSKNYIFNNTKIAIFGNKYLSQDLIVILRNTHTVVSSEAERGGGRWRALPRQTAVVHKHWH